ncbi:hypothetical protein [Amycolatopsis marina]|uniref:hypothetical protein n=1 Tax=Amycolatopsis marina TaxID=490629 RepID=UPI000B8A5A4A|nr:hypothetical protein [Amycolatopsis marina]
MPGAGRVAHSAAQSQNLPVPQTCVLALVLLGAVTGVVAGLVRRLLLGGPALSAYAETSTAPREGAHRRVLEADRGSDRAARDFFVRVCERRCRCL